MQLSNPGAPEPRRGERSVRDRSRRRAHARCSAACLHRGVNVGSAVAAAAAAVMAVASGTDARGEPRGCGRPPSPQDGCAGPACQERSRTVLCGVRRGPAWPHVDVAPGPPLQRPCFLLLFLFFKTLIKVPKAVLKPLKPQIVGFRSVIAWLRAGRRSFFRAIKSVRVPIP